MPRPLRARPIPLARSLHFSGHALAPSPTGVMKHCGDSDDFGKRTPQ
jgi:hypothetical protein